MKNASFDILEELVRRAKINENPPPDDKYKTFQEWRGIVRERGHNIGEQKLRNLINQHAVDIYHGHLADRDGRPLRRVWYKLPDKLEDLR